MKQSSHKLQAQFTFVPGEYGIDAEWELKSDPNLSVQVGRGGHYMVNRFDPVAGVMEHLAERNNLTDAMAFALATHNK